MATAAPPPDKSSLGICRLPTTRTKVTDLIRRSGVRGVNRRRRAQGRTHARDEVGTEESSSPVRPARHAQANNTVRVENSGYLVTAGPAGSGSSIGVTTVDPFAKAGDIHTPLVPSRQRTAALTSAFSRRTPTTPYSDRGPSWSGVAGAKERLTTYVRRPAAVPRCPIRRGRAPRGAPRRRLARGSDPTVAGAQRPSAGRDGLPSDGHRMLPQREPHAGHHLSRRHWGRSRVTPSVESAGSSLREEFLQGRTGNAVSRRVSGIARSAVSRAGGGASLTSVTT